MRIGFNPEKDKIKKKEDFFHQVVMPVYIPNLEGYFTDSFQILKYSLESLIKTSHNKTYISIVNNGSCSEVIDYLQDMFNENKIHEIIHLTNIGYINAILKGIVGHKFTLVTAADADVLFLNNWQEETYKVFQEFPKAGAVCTTPSSKSFNDKTFNILFENFFSKKMKFSKVKNPEALKAFAVSIDNPNFYKDIHLQKYLTVSSSSLKAVVGAGHFVVTYRGNILEEIKEKYTMYVMGGDSDDILDKPAVYQGLWRLATENNYTYHMGNVKEPWMEEILKSLTTSNKVSEISFEFKSYKNGKILFWVKNILLKKIFSKKIVRRWFLKYKGLTKEEAANY